jgi:hypothetical protein
MLYVPNSVINKIKSEFWDNMNTPLQKKWKVKMSLKIYRNVTKNVKFLCYIQGENQSCIFFYLNYWARKEEIMRVVKFLWKKMVS